MENLWSEHSSYKVEITVSLKSQIQKFAPRAMEYSQQDAREFLRYPLKGLYEDVNKVADKPKHILTGMEDNLSSKIFWNLIFVGG